MHLGLCRRACDASSESRAKTVLVHPGIAAHIALQVASLLLMLRFFVCVPVMRGQCSARGIPCHTIVVPCPIRVSSDVYRGLHAGVAAAAASGLLSGVPLLAESDPVVLAALKKESARSARASASLFM